MQQRQLRSPHVGSGWKSIRVERRGQREGSAGHRECGQGFPTYSNLLEAVSNRHPTHGVRSCNIRGVAREWKGVWRKGGEGGGGVGGERGGGGGRAVVH